MRKLCLAVAACSLLMHSVIPVLSQSSGQPPSSEMERRVDALLSQMTLDEKIDLLGGVDDFFIRDATGRDEESLDHPG
ncbi:MAG TPA: hypothetical protein VIW80_23020 [Pyrinomonadaceae bacterium]